MLPPSGQQYVISAEGYAATVTESGGALRLLGHRGRQLVDGFGEDVMSSGGRGQLLMPWPNRIRDGRYEYGGQRLQLGLTEPARHNASHGLARWAAWTPVDQRADRVTLGYRVMSQTGYPWTLDLRVTYALGADGLTVTQSAINRSAAPAPYAAGAHPYLSGGTGPIDSWSLTLPASTRLLTDDERLLPTGTEDVTGTPYDFRSPRPIGDVTFNHAFTDLDRVDGVATTVVGDVELWVDDTIGWLMVYSADDTAWARTSLAVEPMTAPVDAFNSGTDLVDLEPGATHTCTWGIRTAR